MSDLEQFIELVTAYKKMNGHGVGGPLHIVLDDMNVEEHHIRWCVDEWLPTHPCSEAGSPKWQYRTHDGDCTTETKQIADILLSLDEDTRTEWIEEWWSR